VSDFSYTIKPSSNGAAILNTPSKSFLLREVDQSNSLMLFAPSETDGFQLVHTAKKYLEVVSNPNRVNLDNQLPVWDGEMMDVEVKSPLSDLLMKGCSEDYDGRITQKNCCK
jgi:hypothetical protein